MKTEQKELFYLYCLAKIEPTHPHFEKADTEFYPIHFKGTCAVVSRVSPEEFSEDNLKKNLADIEWIEQKVCRHEEVIVETMRHATVIPFKFGTVFNTEENIKSFLDTHAPKFKNMMFTLAGKVEWGVKIYSNTERVEYIINKKDKKIKIKENEISSASPGRAYFLKKKKDELMGNIIDEKLYEWSEDSFQKLKKISVAAKINKILPKEATRRKETMILNSVFLIQNEQTEKFNEVLEELKAKYSKIGLSFDNSGPWPPYNFCDISINIGASNNIRSLTRYDKTSISTN